MAGGRELWHPCLWSWQMFCPVRVPPRGGPIISSCSMGCWKTEKLGLVSIGATPEQLAILWPSKQAEDASLALVHAVCCTSLLQPPCRLGMPSPVSGQSSIQICCGIYETFAIPSKWYMCLLLWFWGRRHNVGFPCLSDQSRVASEEENA